MKDLTKVGGKNASLGEMINTLTPLGISVPDGFAITVDAFCEFLSVNSLSFAVQAELNKLERKSLNNLSEVGRRCRELVMKSIFPQDAEKAIRKAYNELIEKGQSNSVAVRSSATAEDSPTASFAGQHDSFLNIAVADNTITAVRDCYASLFIDRAIKYRIDNGFSDMQVGLSVGIQLMVRTDKGSAGVIFEAYEEFSKFYALHPEVFSSDLKQRILNTATSISRIFIEDNKGVNQHLSELKTLIQLPGISKV